MQTNSNQTSGVDYSARYSQEQFKVGCYVDETAGSADDCNERTIEFAESYGFDASREEWDNEAVAEEDKGQILSEIGDDAVSYLNELETRTAMYWTFEDNSLFLIADVESAKEQVEFPPLFPWPMPGRMVKMGKIVKFGA